MEKYNLFYTTNNVWVTNHDLLDALKRVQAHEANILYIHSGLSFGIPNPEIPKNEILRILLDTILALNVPTICVPTFTFSFCNGEDFDVQNSRSKMGALNEFIRKQPGTIRSVDPLMSVALIGQDTDLALGIGHASIGVNSTFDKLHSRDNVRFLFLGTRPGDCFTYMHFIEKFFNADYRYDRDFTGNIIDGGKSYPDTFTLFVRYRNIFPGKGSYQYEALLYEKGISRKHAIGNSFITTLAEPPAFEIYKEMLEKDHNFFIDPSSIHDHNKLFEVKNMVAL
jgi:aminoglycoside 3-N-acetyltransferase